MKIKVYSQSGKPTNIEDALAYEKDFKAGYDKLWTKKEAGEINIDEMKAGLDELDKELKGKYVMYSEIPLPKSGKAWRELIMGFECPVTLAITEEDHKLALFLMDSSY